MEAKYITLVNTAGKEALWLCSLQRDLQISKSAPLVIYEDNQSTIKTAKNAIFNDRSKHIDVRYHWIHEQVQDGKLEIKYCSPE